MTEPKQPFRQCLGSDLEYIHCVQCGKEKPTIKMSRDIIVDGWTCHDCEMKIGELPEIEYYIDRLERSHEKLLKLALDVANIAEALAQDQGNGDIIMSVASKKLDIEIENKYSETLKEVV